MTEIVAEISGNHGGSLENAIRLIRAAKAAGADAVKFQCFEPAQLAEKRTGVVWDGKKQDFTDLLALYGKTYTPKAWFPTLIDEARLVEIPWFSSVFAPEDVDFLEKLNCPRYKISAYEMLDPWLIYTVFRTGKPIVISLRPTERVTVLLSTEYMSDKGKQIGFSDHTERGWISPGIGMVERHICLPDVESPDRAFSSTPEQFAAYVRAIRA